MNTFGPVIGFLTPYNYGPHDGPDITIERKGNHPSISMAEAYPSWKRGASGKVASHLNTSISVDTQVAYRRTSQPPL